LPDSCTIALPASPSSNRLLKLIYIGCKLYLLMASPQKQQNLKDIINEIKILRSKVDKLENIVEKRLVGEVKPDKYERKAIAELERRRKAGKLQFVPLSKIEENL